MNARILHPVQNSVVAMDATRMLLRGLIDYAGLFPPAALPMEPAVANFHSYAKSEHAWMLGRFIVPVARIGEFEAAAGGLENANAKQVSCSGLSALLGEEVPTDVSRIREFSDRSAASRLMVTNKVESIEVKIKSAQEIDRLSKVIPAELETYFEVPLTAGISDCLAAIAGNGRRAKIRTGGETPDKFPTSENVVEFIRLCAASSVPFKATAGLHHPFRSRHRLTYQPDSPSGIMHGFLNVFLAAVFLQSGMDPGRGVELLDDRSSEAFDFEPDGVMWRGNRLDMDQISAARKDFAISFGSCSFTEPVVDLQSLRLL
jgi:hypothetical protein